MLRRFMDGATTFTALSTCSKAYFQLFGPKASNTLSNVGNLFKNSRSLSVSSTEGALFKLFDEISGFSPVINSFIFLVAFICSFIFLN